MLPGQFAYFGLGHPAQWEQCSAELLLRESKKEVCLVLRSIRGTLEQPALSVLVKLDPRIMSGRDRICTDLLRHCKQLIEL